MRPLKALRSMLMRLADGSEGKFGVSQEYRQKEENHTFPREKA